jgi:hypothetical protein
MTNSYPIKNTTAVPLVVAYEEFDAITDEWLPCADDTVEVIEPGQTAVLKIECLKRRAIFGALNDA